MSNVINACSDQPRRMYISYIVVHCASGGEERRRHFAHVRRSLMSRKTCHRLHFTCSVAGVFPRPTNFAYTPRTFSTSLAESGTPDNVSYAFSLVQPPLPDKTKSNAYFSVTHLETPTGRREENHPPELLPRHILSGSGASMLTTAFVFFVGCV